METDKKGFSNKENGAMLPPYDKDISLKIEVLQEEKSVDSKKRKKDKAKLFRPKNYVCSECGMGFVSSKDLNRHRVVHTGEKPFECPYCDQKFTAPSSRATHIRTIHERSQAYACPQCEKTFNQKSNMIKHYKTIHLETVVIVCQECGREFNQASALRRHVKIVHKKELPHVCQCGKRFALAESLKKHMEAIHLKSRAYPCSYCDYAASRADMLKIHVRKIHTKEWSYKCNICEEKGVEWGCILPKELRRHMQTRHPTQYQLQRPAPPTLWRRSRPRHRRRPGCLWRPVILTRGSSSCWVESGNLCSSLTSSRLRSGPGRVGHRPLSLRVPPQPPERRGRQWSWGPGLWSWTGR